MNIVIAPDSFKGSLSAAKAAHIMKKAIKEVDEDYNIIIKPMADGGEGILESLLESNNGERIPVSCTNALGKKVFTSYGIIHESTAVIESAKIIGLPQVSIDKRNPDNTTTFGIGEVIIDALNNGCTSFIIGVGGSATNEGGFGMLQALGMRAYNKAGEKLGPYGKDFLNFHTANFQFIDNRLKEVSFHVASDVNNPLCGKHGATYVYGTQKGATPEQLEKYDTALRYYRETLKKKEKSLLDETYGSGAAGGLAFSFLFMGAELTKGAEFVAESIKLESVLKEADIVITGEGQTDQQTIEYGKTADFVSKIAQKHKIPILLISGSLQGDMNKIRENFTGCFSIVTSPLSLNSCMKNAEILLYEKTKNVLHFIKHLKNYKI